MAEMEPRLERIDLNRADVDTLAELPGIGPVLAARIVAHRQDVGPFSHVGELTAVSGIAESTVADIKDRLYVASESNEPVQQAPERPEESVEAPAAEPLVGEVAAEAQANGGGEPGPAGESSAVVGEEVVLETPESSVGEAAGMEESEIPEAEPGEEVEVVEDQQLVQPELDQPELVQPELVEEDLGQPEAEAGEDGGEEPSTKEIPIRFLTQGEEAAPVEEEPADGRGAAPAAVATSSAPASSRTGCSLLAVLLGAIVGMFLGALLGLAILAGLNGGSLRFASSNFARQIEQELLGQVDEALKTQEELSRQLATLETEVNGLSDEVTALGDEQATVSQNVGEVQGQVAGLTDTVESVQERVANLAAAAENFTTFLNGLRDLVVELQGTPAPTEPGASLTPRVTVSPSSTSTATVTPAAPGAGTPRPTRTPRPTATPFPVQTATPGR